MIEAKHSLWNYPGANAVVISTNGSVNAAGQAVMGRGCALEAAQSFPGLKEEFGTKLKVSGNHVMILRILPEFTLVSVPVKHKWFENADMELIERSLKELVDLTTYQNWKVVVCPRFGSGYGHLSWDKVVMPVCARILDDRFVVVTHP